MASSSSTNVPIPALSRQQIHLLFAVYGQVVVAGRYHRAGTSAAVSLLVFPVNPGLVDGTVLQPGDEKVLIQAAELETIPHPRAGDYIVESRDGLRRDVVVAQLDLTRQVWTFFARKVYG